MSQRPLSTAQKKALRWFANTMRPLNGHSRKTLRVLAERKLIHNVRVTDGTPQKIWADVTPEGRNVLESFSRRGA